jgi:hypothetical protein
MVVGVVVPEFVPSSQTAAPDGTELTAMVPAAETTDGSSSTIVRSITRRFSFISIIHSS